MKAQPDLFDVCIVVSTGQDFSEKQRVKFLFHGNIKMLQDYVFNLCQIHSCRVENVISIVDLNTGKTIISNGVLK